MEIPKLSPNETNYVNVMATYVLPIVSGINIWINVINIVVLARPAFKGSVYRYLMFISVFDVLTLSLIALKPTLKTLLTENIDDDYLFVYLTSCFLMCSDLTTLAALLERIIRLGGGLVKKNKTNLGNRKHPYRIFIFLILVFSAAVNSPVLYVHRYFEIEWSYRNVYYELCLTPYGWTQFWAKFVFVLGMIINLCIFILAIFFHSSIYKLMKKNAKNLKQLVELETAKSGEFIINIVHDVDDLRSYEDDDVDEVDLDKEISQSASVKGSSKGSNAKSRVRFQSTVEPPSGDLNTMESIASSKHNPIEMESIRKKLCDLVISSSYIYLAGHLPFILINFCQKLINLFAGHNLLDSDNALLAFFHATSNFLLYASLGLTFFIHLIYNVKFRYVIKKAWLKLCCVKVCSTSEMADSRVTANKAEEKIF